MSRLITDGARGTRTPDLLGAIQMKEVQLAHLQGFYFGEGPFLGLFWACLMPNLMPNSQCS